VSEIANASIEQSTGIEAINRALTQMDEVTQQNSALVEENAATAKTLEGQAKSMDDRVAFFRLRAGSESGAIEIPAAVVAPQKRPVLASKSSIAVHRGSAGRLQTGLATALKAEPDWKEF
jgi:methyl-accepting chemotaxis protein